MKKKTKRTIVSLLLLGMVSMIPTGAAFADEYTSDSNFVITGEFTDRFSITTNQDEIFSMPGAAPGDYYSGTIEVTNNSGATMELCILEIQNKLDDASLFDLLELTIQKDGDVLYDGSYGAAGMPVTDYFKIKHGKSIIFDIYVAFPKDAGNAYQGTMMDSLWVFDAHHPGFYYGGGDEPEKEEPEKPPVIEPEPEEPIIVPGEVVEPTEPEDEKKPGIKTGVELIENNTMPVMMLVIAALAALIAFIFIRKAKKNAN